MSSTACKVWRRYKTSKILILSTSCLEFIVILRLQCVLLSAMEIRKGNNVEVRLNRARARLCG